MKDLEEISEKLQLPFLYQVLYRESDFLLPLPGEAYPVSRDNFFSVLRTIRNSDYVLVGGGSLLQDVTSFRSLLYYFSLLRWAQGWNKKVIFYRVGLGPLLRRESRFLVSRLLKKSSLSVFRDEESLDLALRLGASSSFLGCDPLFSFENKEKQGGEKIALFVRPFPEKEKETLCRALSQFSRVEGEDLEVVAFHPERDEEIAKEVAKYLNCPWIIMSQFSQIIPYFEKLKAVFTLRLHPAILATLLDIPWFALNLDPKIQAFSRWWNEENLLSFSQLEENRLVEIYQKKEVLKERGKKINRELEKRSEESVEMLKEFLEKVEKRK